ncbi:Na+/H+ antiporter subunit E [Arcanobacterium hippocoleae]
MRASILQASFILRGKKPNGAIIRVQLRSHSDFYLATVSGMTGLVPGSVVVDVHNATGTLYVHVFDTGLAGGIAGVYKTVLEQEERVLRAFASHDELVDAGYVPGSHPSAGRLPTPYAPDTGSSSVQDSVQLSAAFNGQAPSFSQIAGNELQGKFAGKRDAHSEPDKKCARDIGSESEDGSGMKAPHAGSGKGK